MKPLILKPPKPRNPFACAAHRRVAGRHHVGPAKHRQSAARQLRAELARLHAPPRRPET